LETFVATALKRDCVQKIKKVLVCNRGEIAIRIFRACAELGIKTVAIYSYEDRFSLHRYKADEAYQIGEPGNPVGVYLNIPAIIALAEDTGANAIHPGYGFLSEKIELYRACQAAGIIFVGPDGEALETSGDKNKAVALARRLKIPTVEGSAVLAGVPAAKQFAAKVGYPIILKSVYGGGGRGMRVVKAESETETAFKEASGEALKSFGSSELYAEQFLDAPKHIEVQLIGDGSGSVVHLFERDCSVQRRHQKLIEVAPAASLSDAQRKELYGYALALGRELKLRAAATAEFLVDKSGKIFFIEINPRIQVEHTVTEEITNVDIVQTQLRIADGETLSSLGLTQDKITTLGTAIQCRITTEDPEHDFRPDYGKLVVYRSASGFGIRLDAGSAFTGAVISPYYDSLLVKVTARGADIKDAASKLKRCIREFRVRGVTTNIPFLERVLQNEDFLSGKARTTFLNEHPELFELSQTRDRANRLLGFLADITINGHQEMPGLKRPENLPSVHVPHLSAPMLASPPPKGWRDDFKELGKKKFLEKVRKEKRLLVTDTTFRDAHQSLLATRLRTYDILRVAKPLSYLCPQLFSLEMWGGATFDVALRFLREDPWQRLEQLREAVPNVLFQMLVRGANIVGYKTYPDNLVKKFCAEATERGIDIFRIFDCFNNLYQMQNTIDAVKEAGALAEVCICYTGDVAKEEAIKKAGGNSKYDLSYYLARGEELVKAGAEIIAIKDMAGLLRPYSAELLISALKKEFDVPIHLHTHDTAGGQISTYLKAAEAGVDVVDCAFASMSGVTSQPSLEGLVASLENTARDPGLKVESLTQFSSYWEAVRAKYASFESDLKTATGEVYLNEIPGGQYSNFRPQAASVGLADRWSELKDAYAEVNKMLGNIIKVTPSSKVVGDLALFLVANNLSIDAFKEQADKLNLPASVIELFMGELGEPYGGFDEKLREKVLRGKKPARGRPGENKDAVDFAKAQQEADKLLGRKASAGDTLSLLLYPKVFEQYSANDVLYGDVSVVPTENFLYGLERGEEIVVDLEPGKRLFVSLAAISEPRETGERTVFFELNGQPRNMDVVDKAVGVKVKTNAKADSGNLKHVSAPLAGILVSVEVKAGDKVSKDQTLFTVEAMKMQTGVCAPNAGTVRAVQLAAGTKVESGDLVVEME